MNTEIERKPIVEFCNVTYRHAGRASLLSDVSFRVARGETLVLLGRSGAGKTTALKLINWLLEPTEGEVRIEGRSTLEWDPIALRRHIGYVIQETGLFPHYTVEQNLSVVPRLERWSEDRTRARRASVAQPLNVEPGFLVLELHLEFLSAFDESTQTLQACAGITDVRALRRDIE